MNSIAIVTAIGPTLTQLAVVPKEPRTPWLTVLGVALATVTLFIVLRASYRSVRRCVLCEALCRPLKALHGMKSERVIRCLEEYEGRDVRPENVMTCESCHAVYDLTPRAYVIFGAARLERDEAIAAGVKLQVGDFGCHKCGSTLVESDSPSVTSSDMELIEAAARRVEGVDLRMRLFCQECKLPHLWIPMDDTGYRYLRAEIAND